MNSEVPERFGLFWIWLVIAALAVNVAQGAASWERSVEGSGLRAVLKSGPAEEGYWPDYGQPRNGVSVRVTSTSGDHETSLALPSEGPRMPTVSYFGGGLAVTNKVLWVSATRRHDFTRTVYIPAIFGLDEAKVEEGRFEEVYDRAAFTGHIYSYRVDERVWRTSSTSDVRLFGIAARDRTVVAGADRGKVVVSTDLGDSWRTVEVAVGANPDLTRVSFDAAGRFVVSDDGQKSIASFADGFVWGTAGGSSTASPSAGDEFTYNPGAPGDGLDPAKWDEPDGSDDLASLQLGAASRLGLTYHFTAPLVDDHYVSRLWRGDGGKADRDWTTRARVVMSRQASSIDESLDIELGLEASSTSILTLSGLVSLALVRTDLGDGLLFEVPVWDGNNFMYYPANSVETLLLGYRAASKEMWFGTLGPAGATNVIATTSMSSWNLGAGDDPEIRLYGTAINYDDQPVRITDTGNYFDSFAMAVGPGPSGPGTAPFVGSPTNASGTQGQSFSYQITASNTPTAFAAAGLPSGLIVDAATGLIRGVPNVAGTFTVTASASNANGTGTRTVTISLGAAPASSISAGHSSGGYVPGGGSTVIVKLIHPGGLTALGYELTLPQGWSYASDATTAPIKPSPGQQGVLEWGWFTGFPASPAEILVSLNVPAGQAATRTVQGLMIARQGGPEIRAQAEPNPLVLQAFNPFHSADTNRDRKFSLSELLRVVSLYNYAASNQRTGSRLGREDNVSWMSTIISNSSDSGSESLIGDLKRATNSPILCS